MADAPSKPNPLQIFHNSVIFDVLDVLHSKVKVVHFHRTQRQSHDSLFFTAVTGITWSWDDQKQKGFVGGNIRVTMWREAKQYLSNKNQPAGLWHDQKAALFMIYGVWDTCSKRTETVSRWDGLTGWTGLEIHMTDWSKQNKTSSATYPSSHLSWTSLNSTFHKELHWSYRWTLLPIMPRSKRQF